MAEFVMPGLPKYGAVELKEVYRKYFVRALIVASTFEFLLVGVYWLSTVIKTERPPERIVRILKYSDLGPPPSISTSEVAPAVSMAGGSSVKPSIGIPVPVPDAEVSPEQSFASQGELSQMASPVTESTGSGGELIDIEVEEPPPAFVPFEKEPLCITRIEPVYPEIARKAGLEGNVYAKLWITKEGKVREVVIMKSDSEVFNQAVIDAAAKWRFTPAMMKNGPVAVWLAVPFKFTLK